MNKPRSIGFCALALLCVFALSLIWGCGGGGGGGPAGGQGGQTLLRGSVAGLLAAGPDGKVVFIAGALPAGFTARSGVTVSIAGGPSTTTGADGKFSLARVSVGSRTLQINPAGGAAFTIPLTVIPNAIVTPGDPPITRAAALDLVKQALTADTTLAGSGIWATQQPIPAGVTLGSALWIGDKGGPSMTIDAGKWLVYVDTTPLLRFGHDVRCYLVDTQSGVITNFDSDSWPALNGFGFYHPINAGEAASPDLLQAPPARAAAPGKAATTWSATDNVPNTGRATTATTYALLVRGTESLATGPDVDHVKAILGHSLTFPVPTIVDYLDIPKLPTGTGLVDAVQSHFNALAAKTKPGDTFVFYVSTHGVKEVLAQNDGNLRNPANWRYLTVLDWQPLGQQYYVEKLDPLTLDFSKIAACNIVLIIDTCYSGGWITALQQKLTGLAGKKVVVMTSTAWNRPGFDSPEGTVEVGGNSVTLLPGGLYTSALQAAFTAGFTHTDLYSDLVGAQATAGSVVQTYWDLAHSPYGKGQFPQIWQRPLVEGEGCFSESVTVKSVRRVK